MVVVDMVAMTNQAMEDLEMEIKEAGVHNLKLPTIIPDIHRAETVRLEDTVYNQVVVLLLLPIHWVVAVQATAHTNSHTTVEVDTMKIQDLVVMVILGHMEVAMEDLVVTEDQAVDIVITLEAETLGFPKDLMLEWAAAAAVELLATIAS